MDSDRDRFNPATAVLLVLMLFVCGAASAQEQKTAQKQQHPLNRLVEIFREGGNAFGLFVDDLSPRQGAAASSSGLDFVILDLEHSPYDPSRLEAYLLGMIDKRRLLTKGSLQPDVVPIIRLPGNGREGFDFLIKQVLDLGAFGVVVPHIENREQATAAVRAMRYPQRKGVKDSEPAGRRGIGYGWPSRYWGLPGEEYARRADLWPLDPEGDLLLWCMVESTEGVRNAREIMTTPGVSGVFIGPSDLATSMGVPLGGPEVKAEVARLAALCRETGALCGTTSSEGQIIEDLRSGFRFLTVGGRSLVSGSSQRALQAGRNYKRRQP